MPRHCIRRMPLPPSGRSAAGKRGVAVLLRPALPVLAAIPYSNMDLHPVPLLPELVLAMEAVGAAVKPEHADSEVAESAACDCALWEALGEQQLM